MMQEEVYKRYDSVKPNETTIPMHEFVRDSFKAIAGDLDALLPEGREKSLMHTKLEEASMWANKAVAEVSRRTNE